MYIPPSMTCHISVYFHDKSKNVRLCHYSAVVNLGTGQYTACNTRQPNRVYATYCKTLNFIYKLIITNNVFFFLYEIGKRTNNNDIHPR